MNEFRIELHPTIKSFQRSLSGILRLFLAGFDITSWTDTVTSEFVQLTLKSLIRTALQIVSESLMEQHSSSIVKRPQGAAIFLQCTVNSFVTTHWNEVLKHMSEIGLTMVVVKRIRAVSHESIWFSSRNTLSHQYTELYNFSIWQVISNKYTTLVYLADVHTVSLQ